MRTRLLLPLALIALPSCALVYRHTIDTPTHTIHSDHERAFVAETSELIERIHAQYRELFDMSAEEAGRFTVLLEGESDDVVDFSPELLGYYLPLLRLVSVNTTPLWTRRPGMLRQILLHEIGHHFLITRHPDLNDRCWINEGLAGNLEMALFRDSHFEFILLNPTLLLTAKRIVKSDGSSKHGRLRDLIGLSWSEFHDDRTKQVNYALAWSFVHFALCRELAARCPDGAASSRVLGEVIAALVEAPEDELFALEDEWVESVRDADLTGILIDLASRDGSDSPLTRAWALRRLGELHGLDDRRARDFVRERMESSDPEIRRDAAVSYVKISARLAHGDCGPWLEPIDEDSARIAKLILDTSEPIMVRRAIVSETSRSLEVRPSLIPNFIALLSDPVGELRALAARSLGAMGKPTVMNPRFWIDADPEEREREVQEWREWWRQVLERNETHAAGP